ncbi:MAG: hypothetical protein Kow00124_19540 [Anaerolineae bacterium]
MAIRVEQGGRPAEAAPSGHPILIALMAGRARGQSVGLKARRGEHLVQAAAYRAAREHRETFLRGAVGLPRDAAGSPGLRVTGRGHQDAAAAHPQGAGMGLCPQQVRRDAPVMLTARQGCRKPLPLRWMKLQELARPHRGRAR